MHNPLSRPGGRRTARRAAALGATAALVAGLTTACGGASGSSSKTALGPNDTLKITTFSDFGYDKLIDEWNADPKHPFLVNQTKIADWDPWKQTLTSDLQAGTGLPDIVAIEGDSMPEFLAPGASDQFVDLSDPSLANRWLEYKYKAGQTADGKQIGYPTDAGPEAFCYNADLFKKAGSRPTGTRSRRCSRAGTPTSTTACGSKGPSPARSGSTTASRSRRRC